MNIRYFTSFAAEHKRLGKLTDIMNQLYLYVLAPEDSLNDIYSPGFFNQIAEKVQDKDVLFVSSPSDNRYVAHIISKSYENEISITAVQVDASLIAVDDSTFPAEFQGDNLQEIIGNMITQIVESFGLIEDRLEKVATRTALKALDTTSVKAALLLESGRYGIFAWKDGNYSTHVAADTEEGVYIKANAIASSAGAWRRVYDGDIDVRWFGAIGDGTTDDTTACSKAIDFVYFVGGGALFFHEGTYIVTGLTIKDSVRIVGSNKIATTIKLQDDADEHVIQAGEFDTYANGVERATPVGCRTGGVENITIDGNKANQTDAHHGIAYYGIDLYLNNVEVKNCKGWGIYCESPGATYSVVAGQNLQYSWAHVEAHDNVLGNIAYNGQSDSTLLDIVCYECGGEDSGEVNFMVLDKGVGIRVIGIHCWGKSEYGIVNEAATAGFTHAHVESAKTAKVWMKVATYFDGRVYEAGSNISAPAFLIITGLTSYNIRATISRCEIAVSYEGTDGGNALIDIQHYSNSGTAALFSGTPSATVFIRANLFGIVNSHYFQTPSGIQMNSEGTRYNFASPGLGYGFFTDENRTLRQFGIEHTASVESYLAATGGATSAGPSLIARGTGDNYDIQIIPKGTGVLRFGTHSAIGVKTVTGYISIKDSDGNARDIAVVS